MMIPELFDLQLLLSSEDQLTQVNKTRALRSGKNTRSNFNEPAGLRSIPNNIHQLQEHLARADHQEEKDLTPTSSPTQPDYPSYLNSSEIPTLTTMSAAKARQERMLEEVLRLPGNSTSLSLLLFISPPLHLFPMLFDILLSFTLRSLNEDRRTGTSRADHNSSSCHVMDVQIDVRIVRPLRLGGLVSVSVSQFKSSSLSSLHHNLTFHLDFIRRLSSAFGLRRFVFPSALSRNSKLETYHLPSHPTILVLLRYGHITPFVFTTTHLPSSNSLDVNTIPLPDRRLSLRTMRFRAPQVGHA